MMTLFSGSAGFPKIPMEAASLMASGELKSKPPLFNRALWQPWHFDEKAGGRSFRKVPTARVFAPGRRQYRMRPSKVLQRRIARVFVIACCSEETLADCVFYHGHARHIAPAAQRPLLRSDQARLRVSGDFPRTRLVGPLSPNA